MAYIIDLEAKLKTTVNATKEALCVKVSIDAEEIKRLLSEFIEKDEDNDES